MKEEPCRNCFKHKATENWGGTWDSLSLARTGYSLLRRWCKCCVLSAQAKHMQEIADKLPAVLEELATVICR